MKVNAINSTNYMTKETTFRHVTVPYPEYESAYFPDNQPSSITKMVEKISALFTPEVTKQSKEIKNDINKIYSANNVCKNPHEHLLSVLA